MDTSNPKYTRNGYNDSITDHVATDHGYQIRHPKVIDTREESLSKLREGDLDQHLTGSLPEQPRNIS